jgi:hypothetical protein
MRRPGVRPSSAPPIKSMTYGRARTLPFCVCDQIVTTFFETIASNALRFLSSLAWVYRLVMRKLECPSLSAMGTMSAPVAEASTRRCDEGRTARVVGAKPRDQIIGLQGGWS